MSRDAAAASCAGVGVLPRCCATWWLCVCAALPSEDCGASTRASWRSSREWCRTHGRATRRCAVCVCGHCRGCGSDALPIHMSA